jgi:hypothetical protein
MTGLEMLHAWNKVSESWESVDMHFDVIVPWSGIAMETLGDPIWEGIKAGDEPGA